MVLGSYFYKQKTHESKRQFYECGFKSLGDINFQINLNFLMLCVFLVLYDIEFTLIYPFLFNIDASNIFNVLVLFIFMLLIIVSLIYD
jgi:NADH:ubiquinone oxidoreductase subunit 3 (subunit A)